MLARKFLTNYLLTDIKGRSRVDLHSSLRRESAYSRQPCARMVTDHLPRNNSGHEVYKCSPSICEKSIFSLPCTFFAPIIKNPKCPKCHRPSSTQVSHPPSPESSQTPPMEFGSSGESSMPILLPDSFNLYSTRTSNLNTMLPNTGRSLPEFKARTEICRPKCPHFNLPIRMEDALIGVHPEVASHQAHDFDEWNCLNLNITIPATARNGSKLPVMLNIHGGGNHSGANSDWWNDGASIVKRSIELGKPIVHVGIK